MEPVGERDWTKHRDGSSRSRPSHWRWIVPLVFIFLIIGLFIYFHVVLEIDWENAYTRFSTELHAMGFWGELGIILLMILHCFVPFPAEFLALAAGNLYGFVHGTILMWIGAMIGASLSFALSRWLGKPFVEWVLPQRHQEKLDQWTEDQGAMTLLISRFIPLIAFNLINYAAGLTKVKWWTFLWTTGLGILPITAITVYMGHGMRELKAETLFFVSFLSILVMVILHFSLKNTQSD